MLGSWEKQRALIAYEGACQVWTEGLTVAQLCYICHPGICGPFIGCFRGSFVLCVCASLFLFTTLPIQSVVKVLRLACCIHSRRLPSWSRALRDACSDMQQLRRSLSCSDVIVLDGAVAFRHARTQMLCDIRRKRNVVVFSVW